MAKSLTPRKQPARIVIEIRDEARLWIQAGVKDLSVLVSPIVSKY
jgi:hypothetical protein